MDVIPVILTEQAVADLPEDILRMIADCSTQLVMNKVELYLESETVSKDIVEKVKRAYGDRLGLRDYLGSEELAEKVKWVKSIEYKDIKPTLSKEELTKIREVILEIIQNENAVPYLTPIEGTKIVQVKERLKAIKNDSRAIGELYNLISKHADLFRDARSTACKGTVVKKVIREKKKFEIIAKGAEFLLCKKEQGAFAGSWRYL